MAGHRKRARKDCGRKRSRAQKPAEKRKARALTPAERLERRRKRYAEDPQYRKKIIASVRAYYAANKTEIQARQSQRYAKDASYRDKLFASRLKRDYGITPEEYAAMFKRQKGRCAICRKKFRYRLGVDHCPGRHIIRGLLCLPCNLGLGNFRDRPALLRRAAKYLEWAVRNAKKLPRLRAIPYHDRARRPGPAAKRPKAVSPPARTRRSACRRAGTSSRRCAETSA